VYWFGGIPAFHADYLSFLRYGLPALISLWVYNFWISRARTLPYFAEVTDTVTAFAITAALVSAAVRPFGRPFKVTDKGGDRTRSKVRWRLALVFGFVAATSAAGIAWSFVSPYAASEVSPADLFNLLWASVAMIISFSAFLVCFERPRSDEQFAVEQHIDVQCGARTFACILDSMSLSSATLRDFPWQAILGTAGDVALLMSAVGRVAGRASLARDGAVSVALLPSAQQRRRLIVHLFASRIENVARTARLRPALSGVLRRAFRPGRS
jgi:cellulose synthase (UDP-forming)